MRHIFRIFLFLFVIPILSFSVTRCAGPQEEVHGHGEMAPVKTYPRDYVHPLAEINLGKVFEENRGLKVLEENATTVHDFYRGSVQEKEEGERALNEERWEDARVHLETSNRFLTIVLKVLPEDDAYRNIYGDQVIVFLPHLLMADNYLKLISVYKKMGMDEEAVRTVGYGKYSVSQSLKSVKTEWAFQVQKRFEEALPGK